MAPTDPRRPQPAPDDDPTALQPPPASGRGSYGPPSGPPPSHDATVLQPPPASGRGSYGPHTSGPAPNDDATVGPAGGRTPAGNGPASSGLSRSSPTAAGGGEDLEAAPGSFIGGYEVVKTLGRGGMGIVYLARDPRLDRKVALKVLPITAGTHESAVARFQREAKAIATLDHPNIRPIFGWGRDDLARVFWLAMGFVDGRPYDDVVKEVGLGHESARRAARVVADAARALAYAHARGIVHRDVKPANLMLEGAKVHVVDFGLARLEGSAELTVEGQVMGTLKFMPPEQALGAEASALSDVYSLGATLFWALTGEGPYEAERIENLQLRMARGDAARRPTALRPDVPRDLEAIICKSLELEPTDRYGGAAALADDLERFLAGDAVVARPPSRWRALKHLLRRNAWVVLPAALLLGALGALGLVARQRTKGADEELGAIRRDWEDAGVAALLKSRQAYLLADPEGRASSEAWADRDRDLKTIDARLHEEVRSADAVLRGAVEAWVRPADGRPLQAVPDSLKERAGAALDLAKLIGTRDEAVAAIETSLNPWVADAAASLEALATDLAALAGSARALQRTLPGRLELVGPDGAGSIVSGKAPLPAWGVLVRAERNEVRSARIYDPLDLLEGVPAPRPLRTTSRTWEGMVRIEVPRSTVQPFLIDLHEVTQAQFARFVRDGYDVDANWTDEGRAWRDRDPRRRAKHATIPADGQLPVSDVSLHEARAFARSRGRRLPTAAEWQVAAGLEPWRATVTPDGGTGPLRSVADEPWDTSPCGVANMASNVAEWVDGPPAIFGGDCAATGFHLGRSQRQVEHDPTVGFRCALTAPDLQGGAP